MTRVNHPIRVVTLTTAERVLCLFTDVRDENNDAQVIGYKMAEPYTLTLGEADESGNFPVKYNRWCMYSPEREFMLSGNHIIAVSVPDENIVEQYATQLEASGISKDQIFIEEDNGDNSEPTETSK
jgi:hypothetical protein